MADYLTQADVTGRFGSDEDVSFLTDTESSGTPSATVIAEVIDAAEGKVNAYLAVRYATPVVSTDAATTAAVKRLALDLAEAYLRSRKKPVSTDTLDQIARVIEDLKELAAGTAVLPGAETPESTASRDPLASWSGSTRTLSDTSPRLFTRETAARS